MKFLIFSTALVTILVAKAGADIASMNPGTSNKVLPLPCFPPYCCAPKPEDSITITESVTISIDLSPVLNGYVYFPNGLTLCNIRGLLKNLCQTSLSPVEEGIVFDGRVNPSCFGGSTPEYQTYIDAKFCGKNAKLRDITGNIDKASAILDHPETPRVWGKLLNDNGNGSLTNFCMEKPSVWFARLLIENLMHSSDGVKFESVGLVKQCAIGSSMNCWFNYLWDLDKGYTFVLLVKAIVEELVKHINFNTLLGFMKECDLPKESEFYRTCPYTDGPRVETCPVPVKCW